MKLKLSVLSLLLLCAIKITIAQTTIAIPTQNTALVLQAEKDKNLNVVYYGKSLKTADEYTIVASSNKINPDNDNYSNATDAYPASGGANLLEPAITVTHSNGNNSLDLKYVSHTVKQVDNNVKLTTVLLKDLVYQVEVKLFYQSYFKENVIEQWSEIKNNEKGSITLYKYASAFLPLTGNAFWLNQFHGNWAREMKHDETLLTQGIKTLDSKQNTRANLFQASEFMVSLNQKSTETSGDVVAGALQWPGNFRMDFELFENNKLRIIAGINNYASPYTLKANDVFVTPKFTYTFSSNGKGNASRNLQKWVRNYSLVDGNGDRYTLLNNWETTYFAFNDEKLKGLAQDTKKLGVDLFLLDDGWFGNKYPRDRANAALGDWGVNTNKLKNGIAGVIKETDNNNVKFGIWIEPEMVNPKSELYEKHPDWVIKQPGRAEFYMRNQLVLDLCNPKVQDFVFNVVDDLFTQNPKLAYIKWDCNSQTFNAFSPYLKNQAHFYIEYVSGLTKVLEKIRAKYPKVPIMLCSSGGGRVDYGSLKYFTEYWPSDNTDPLERIFIQWGYSYFFPAIASANHVTEWGKQPIKYKVDVAMMGKLGFDLQVNKLEEKELAFCQGAIKTYNQIKNTVLHGDQYRLANPEDGTTASMGFVNEQKSEAIIFNFFTTTRYFSDHYVPIKMQGLDADKKYSIKELNLYDNTKTTIDEAKVYSGDYLMTVGFNPEVNMKRTSVILQLQEKK
jgi:alpha-galactosidase